MQPCDVVEFFKGGTNAAKELQVSKQAVSKWVTQGFIPHNTQYRIQDATNGLLVADPQAVFTSE